MKKPVVPDQISHFVSDWHLSPGIDTGDFVFFSGVTGAHLDLSVARKPKRQFRDALQFLQGCLAEAGLSFDDVVEMTTYHVNLRQHLDDFTEVKDEFIKEPFPAWSAIGVSELITEGTLVEIRVIARRTSA